MRLSHGPNPLAGRRGVGPPVAPPHWQWRCGPRVRDMTFINPVGQSFRSKTAIISYLNTLPDAPTAAEFCWRVTPEILERGTPTLKAEDKADDKPGGERKRNDGETDEGQSKISKFGGKRTGNDIDGEMDEDKSKKSSKNSKRGQSPCNNTQVPTCLDAKPLAAIAPGENLYSPMI